MDQAVAIGNSTMCLDQIRAVQDIYTKPSPDLDPTTPIGRVLLAHPQYGEARDCWTEADEDKVDVVSGLLTPDARFRSTEHTIATWGACRINFNFPKLENQYIIIKGTASAKYNCIAWSAGDTKQNVDPHTIQQADAYYKRHGFTRQERLDVSHTEGVQKVALYGHYRQDNKGVSRIQVVHASVEESSGIGWSSKMGSGELMLHRGGDSLAGGAYGDVIAVYYRKADQRHTKDRLCPIKRNPN